MNRERRVLLLSARIGAGHVRAAQAIEQALRGMPGIAVSHRESLACMPAAWRVLFTGTYAAMLSRAPSLYRALYRFTEQRAPKDRAKRWASALMRLSAGPLRDEIRAAAPDCIVCTHFLPAAVAASMWLRGEHNGRVAVVITDYTSHPIWLHPGVRRYFVGTQRVAEAITETGVPGAHIQTAGIPVSEPFALPPPDKAAMRVKLGLPTDRATVLVAGGGCGIGGLDTICSVLARQFPGAQFLAVAGENRRLHESLIVLERETEGRVTALGFVSNMHELMAASDFAVTKPGGVTTSECLAVGLPMLLVAPIPGQEEGNAAFLSASGAALCAASLGELGRHTALLLNDESARRRLAEAARVLGRPHAARQIAEAAVALAQEVDSAVEARPCAHPALPPELSQVLG